MRITKDFTCQEFVKSETAEKQNIKNDIPSVEVLKAIIALTKNVLQPLRDAYHRPLCIISGYRCPELNSIVGGVPASQHLKGEAADIYTGENERSYNLAKLAKDIKLPYDQMILYPSFVHFSYASKRKQRGQILYDRKYKGREL